MFGWHKRRMYVLTGIKFQSLHLRPLEAAARALGDNDDCAGSETDKLL